MSTDLILFQTSGTEVALAASAEDLKTQALAAGALVGAVTNQATNQAAVEAMQSIKRVLDLAEKSRVAVKQVPLDLCRAIDARAKEFVAELKEEFQRISLASADWQTEQLERVKAQERARAEEAARIERERLMELRKLEQEAALAAAKAKSLAEQQRLAEEAARKAQELNERKAQEQLSIALPQIPATAPGQKVTTTWMWEVTDVYSLVRLHPGLVEITPRRQEINLAIESLAQAGEPRIAGLRIWKETKVGVRLSRGKTVDI